MPIYERASNDVRDLVNRTMELYHGPLHDVETRVDVLLATPKLNKKGIPTGPAVKYHGKKCAAVIRTVSYKDRVKGAGDLEITIDEEWWMAHDEEQRIALLDHELTHREPKLDKNGAVKTDDLGRPKFVRIDHDFEFGWFATTALRHGKLSVEVEQARQMIESERWQNCIQRFLPGLEPIDVARSEATATRVLPSDWKQWPIDELGEFGLSVGKVKLLSAEFGTMGKLMESLAKAEEPGFWCKAVKGLGENGYAALTEAIAAMRKARPAFAAADGDKGNW